MADVKVFHDSVIPIPVSDGPTPNGLVVQPADKEHGDEVMTLHFQLGLPEDKEAELEAMVARGETVAPETLHQDYSANKADADALASWLKDRGFEIKEISPDNTSIYAAASVSQIEKSLDVSMVRVNRNGLTYTSARNAPSLPTSVGDPVVAISGLQPFRQMHKHRALSVPIGGNRVELGATTPEGPPPSPSIANKAPYLVSEICNAYNAHALGVDGTGQTIAILIDTFPSDDDIRKFWQHNGLPTDLTRIEKVNVGGGHLPAPEGEETLDASWTSGIAPGAKIRIYATGTLDFVALDRALDRILADVPSQPGMRQLSISLGLGETYLNGPGGEVATEHQKFLKLAAAGVNVFVSTGDAGSSPDETGHSPTGPVQAEYESSDPCVVAVGGTTLRLSATGKVASETGWSSSGGGKSMYFNRPAWQTGSGITGGRRLVPDVSSAADPQEGAFLVLNGRTVQIGGTSWSAPVWAGFCALMNEARQKSGKATLPFLNPLIYPLAAKGFRNITKGSNGVYHATPGFDLVTGLGVPNVQKLIAALT